jgi:S-formylglutathione hydrolase
METLARSACFGGVQGVYRHAAQETRCAMRFGVFLPP